MQRVASAGNTAAVTRPRKERRVTYVVRSSDEATHCSGVNALQVGSSFLDDSGTSGEGDKLFSGSRDGTIKRWDLQSTEPSCGATFESHVDWVNDMVLLGDDILVSGSSDTSIKAWRAYSSGECVRTFRRHGDYVTALASATDTNVIASGGLGGEVYVWDLEAASAPLARPAGDGNAESTSGSNGGSYGSLGGAGPGRPATGSSASAASNVSDRSHNGGGTLLLPDGSISDLSYTPVAAKGHKESVYALAMNSTGTVLVSGGTEKALRVWDPRTGKKQWKLKGHTDNVRAILLDPSGRLCLSGSSDSIIRLWDVGQQRCIHSYAVHTDSVWALAGNPASNTIYSGGRDGCIYLTDLVSRESVLIAVEKQPVLRLALHGKDWIWAATTSSALRKWSTESPEEGRQLRTSSSFKAGSGLARMRSSIDESALPEPVNERADLVIEGSAGILRHTVLNDRRRVLTKDSDGIVKLWEITRGAVIEDFGKVSFEEKEKELFEKVSVSPWFTMDTRLGSIAVHLDTPQCFSAEMYALDCNVEGASEEVKINLGQHTLRGLFEHWLARNHCSTALPNGDALNGTLPEAPVDGGAASASSGEDVPGDEPWLDGVLPAFQFSRTCPPSIITEGTHGGPWRRKATDLLGTEGPREIPQWCIDATLHNKLPLREPPKCSFFLAPHEGSSLSPLPQGKLTAPRILRIQKVMNYVVERLGLVPTDEDDSSSTINGGTGIAAHATKRPLNSQAVEILCNDEVLLPDASLATIRAYVWKKPEDLSLFYRTAQPR